MVTTSPDPNHLPPGYLEEDLGYRTIAATSVILVIATILLTLRLYARTLTAANRGWDEFLLVPSWFLLLGLLICLYLEVTAGSLGQHVEAVMRDNPNKIVVFLKLLYVLDWFYVPSNMLSRISVVSLYLRIFTNRFHRGLCWFVIAFLIGNCVATIIAAQLECFPIQYIWDKSLHGGHCFNQLLWYRLTNIPNVVADVMILLLPMPIVWRLQASIGRKAGIATVFLTGSIGLVASCVRTSVFFSESNDFDTDPTFTDQAFSWTAVECGMYFSAACLIGLRPLIKCLPGWLRDRIPHTPTLASGASSLRRHSAVCQPPYQVKRSRSEYGHHQDSNRYTMRNCRYDYHRYSYAQPNLNRPKTDLSQMTGTTDGDIYFNTSQHGMNSVRSSHRSSRSNVEKPNLASPINNTANHGGFNRVDTTSTVSSDHFQIDRTSFIGLGGVDIPRMSRLGESMFENSDGESDESATKKDVLEV